MMSSLFTLIVIVLVVAIVIGLFTKYVAPIDPAFRTILIVLVVTAACAWLLMAIGLLPIVMPVRG